MTDPKPAIQTMTSRIAAILSACSPSIYLYGSCTLGDFRPVAVSILLGGCWIFPEGYTRSAREKS